MTTTSTSLSPARCDARHRRSPAMSSKVSLPARVLRHDERLDEPVLADAAGELLQLGLVEVLPRLPLLGDDLLDRGTRTPLPPFGPAVAAPAAARREQGVEPAPERAPRPSDRHDRFVRPSRALRGSAGAKASAGGSALAAFARGRFFGSARGGGWAVQDLARQAQVALRPASTATS